MFRWKILWRALFRPSGWHDAFESAVVCRAGLPAGQPQIIAEIRRLERDSHLFHLGAEGLHQFVQFELMAVLVNQEQGRHAFFRGQRGQRGNTHFPSERLQIPQHFRDVAIACVTIPGAGLQDELPQALGAVGNVLGRIRDILLHVQFHGL